MSGEYSRRSEIEGLLSHIVLSPINTIRFDILHSYDVTVAMNWGISNREMTNFFMVYIVDGCGSYRFKNELIEMKPGRVIFIDYNQKHTIDVDPDNPPTFISIHFNIYNKNKIFEGLGIASFFMDIGDSQKIKRCFKEIYYYKYLDEQKLGINMCHHLMGCLFNELYIESNKKAKPYNVYDDRIEKAKNYLDENFDEKLRIEIIAKDIGLSRKHFSEKFKQIYGVSPKKYLIDKKISHARYLLEQTDLSVKGIADMMGYPDMYTFSRQFKKMTGYAPTRYRENKQVIVGSQPNN